MTAPLLSLLMKRLARELHFGFQRVGELTVAQHDAQLPALEKLLHHAAVKGVPGVERWTRAERAALAAVARAKGGRRESDYAARLDAHPRLRAALVRLATR